MVAHDARGLASLSVAELEEVLASLGRPDRLLIPSCAVAERACWSLLEQGRGVPQFWPLKPEELEIRHQTVPRFPMRIL
jgi:hypothetical protein